MGGFCFLSVHAKIKKILSKETLRKQDFVRVSTNIDGKWVYFIRETSFCKELDSRESSEICMISVEL